MRDHRDVILHPVISEKSYEMISENKYTFVVDPRANKTQIRQAVEAIFAVRVLSVNTLNRRGKVKRRGLQVGKRPDTKRAIVTVAPGDRIELFDAGI